MTIAGARALSVLVLEDDADIRAALSEALEVEGFATAGAARIAEAIAIVDAGETDAVLVDLRLADGELGSDFIRLLADSERSPAVVILSASSELAAPLVVEYNLAFIRKPFDLDAVIGAIRSAVVCCARPRRSSPVPAG